MKIIVCLDDNNGMLFNKRRQSSDRVVTEKICDLVKNEKLWIDTYSSKLFATQQGSVIVDDSYAQKAETGDFCFVEQGDVQAIANVAEEIIVFRWNRRYPADIYFPGNCLSARKKVMTEAFSGYSHEEITMEVYR